MLKLLVVVIIKSVLSTDEFFSSNSLSVVDQCNKICKENSLPSLELENYEQVVCQRGCKYFNIIRFKDELNLQTTKKECHLSCEESYIIKTEQEVCFIGCNLMGKKQQNDIPNFIVLTEDDNNETNNNIVLVEPDLEILETDILSDPSIKSQLEIGFNIDYKIPETHIRTMPIAIEENPINYETNGDWLDCASRNSGIPRWILLTVILSAVLIALYLSFSSDKKSCSSDEEILTDINVNDEKLILENEEINEKTTIPPLPQAITLEYHVESEKV